jgi:hypothetical protein
MNGQSPFPIFLALFGVVAVVLIVVGTINGRRAMLDRLVPFEGETTLLELDVDYTVLLYQHAVKTSFVYLRARLRVTDKRVIVAQHGLGSKRCVVRYIGYRNGTPPSDTENGYPCFAIAPPAVVVDGAGKRELRIVPRQPAPIFPQYVAIRSERLDEIARVLGMPA